MENNLDHLLDAYKSKQDETWLKNVMQLNMAFVEHIHANKARSKLNKLAKAKVATVVLGIVWILFLLLLVIGHRFQNLYFGISISAILLFNVAAVWVYLKQIILIRRINYSNNITETQQQIAELQLSTIKITRILFLQMPFHCTWFWHPSWIIFTEWHFWLISFPVVLMFTFLSLWLYKNVRIENKDKKWFKWLFNSMAWSSLVQAQEFINDIEEFRKE